MNDITVLGIFVADISFSGNKIPAVGETILGNKYNIGPGGKGCNQAVAIARLGGKVNFISKIGKDSYGELALNTLKKNKISTENIIEVENVQTGVAGILVDKNSGKNAINVIVGAPSTLKINEIDNQINTIKNSKIFLTQLEVPKDVTLHCLKIAKENGCITVLNPAPASEISKEFYNNIDFFTPNETEAEFYTGIKITNEKDAKQAANKLINLGIKKVIITLGEKGLFYSDGNEEIYFKANSVKAIDTTGAGDAFNGGLAFGLSKGKSIKDCLELANKVAGISTTKLGAGDAMPFTEDLK
ncbi:MAG: ribokinase [Pseudomonadota bacterium]|nr:ribokinase [Pseudomonadota bacterium]|tara:strand:+ start:522 stop:1424 length:903 start_codon:yes stop_codon:yes gene_type:complete